MSSTRIHTLPRRRGGRWPLRRRSRQFLPWPWSVPGLRNGVGFRLPGFKLRGAVATAAAEAAEAGVVEPLHVQNLVGGCNFIGVGRDEGRTRGVPVGAVHCLLVSGFTGEAAAAGNLQFPGSAQVAVGIQVGIDADVAPELNYGFQELHAADVGAGAGCLR